MTWGAILLWLATLALCLYIWTLNNCCAEYTEREKRFYRRWAVVWLIVCIGLGSIGGALWVLGEKETLDGRVHEH